MQIASLYFFLFFIVVLAAYYAVPQRVRWGWLLAASYAFYLLWSIEYTVVLLSMTVFSYVVGLQIQGDKPQVVKRRVMLLGIIGAFATLGIFKYTNFVLSSVDGVLQLVGAGVDVPLLDIFFPIGISFFALQIVSYITDVYNEVTPAEAHLGRYALYVAFFPQLIMGPIERAADLLPQLAARHTFDYQTFVGGLLRIGWGFWKKLVIADRLAVVTNTTFADPVTFSGPQLAFAVLLYSIQIYADFSAYCDIVIGMAQILGIQLTENFNHPYFATSPIDFWRRWHITLSNWLRDYIFYPLNFAARRNLTGWVQTRNILLVFLFSGLWHGASWTFVIWGALHGVYQAVELALQRRAKRLKQKPDPRWWKTVLSVALTFMLVTFAWIFFRAESVGEAFYIIGSIASLDSPASPGVLWEFATIFEQQVVAMLMASFVLVEVVQFAFKTPVWEFARRSPLPVRWAMSLVLIFSVLIFGYYGETDAAAFIYSGF